MTFSEQVVNAMLKPSKYKDILKLKKGRIYFEILRCTCVSPCSCTSMYTPVGEAACALSFSYLHPFTNGV